MDNSFSRQLENKVIIWAIIGFMCAHILYFFYNWFFNWMALNTILSVLVNPVLYIYGGGWVAILVVFYRRYFTKTRRNFEHKDYQKTQILSEQPIRQAHQLDAIF